MSASLDVRTASAERVDYQSRYLAYCAAHGMTPEAMEATDRERHPGGFMAGFIVWMSEQWCAWEAETKRPRALAEPGEFDAWLAGRSACEGRPS